MLDINIAIIILMMVKKYIIQDLNIESSSASKLQMVKFLRSTVCNSTQREILDNFSGLNKEVVEIKELYENWRKLSIENENFKKTFKQTLKITPRVWFNSCKLWPFVNFFTFYYFILL